MAVAVAVQVLVGVGVSVGGVEVALGVWVAPALGAVVPTGVVAGVLELNAGLRVFVGTTVLVADEVGGGVVPAAVADATRVAVALVTAVVDEGTGVAVALGGGVPVGVAVPLASAGAFEASRNNASAMAIPWGRRIFHPR
ncbi:MAG: hypothetical protein JO247_21810 [Chloroflexi bacterium]|nr:hypothetical protein [Chloroflexota bacterium]